MRIGSIALAAGIAILSVSAAMCAQAKDFHLRYAKAELETPAGAERVYHRIYDVAEELCDYEVSSYYASISRLRYDRCMRRTVKSFVGEIDHPHVNSAFASLPVRRKKDELKEPYKRVENN